MMVVQPFYLHYRNADSRKDKTFDRWNFPMFRHISLYIYIKLQNETI